MTTITLKDILTNENLKAFFKHSSQSFAHFAKAYLHFIKTTLLAFKNCREFSFAKAIFSCPNCSYLTYRPVTCKSKFCSSCGKIYAENWAHKTTLSLKKIYSLLFLITLKLSLKIGLKNMTFTTLNSLVLHLKF